MVAYHVVLRMVVVVVLVSATSSFLIVQREGTTTHPHSFVKKACCNHYIPDESPQIQRLMEWLSSHQEGIGYRQRQWNDVAIGSSSEAGIRGVFSKRSFLPGDVILKIPYTSSLVINEEYDKFGQTKLLRAQEPHFGFQFWQRYMNDTEARVKYQSYFDCLPLTSDDPHFDPTPDFWSEDEIRQVELPSLVDQWLSRKRYIYKMVNDAGQSDNRTTILLCCWLVQTRAFTITYKKKKKKENSTATTTTRSLSSRVVLIPFLDMVNHARLANARIKVVENITYPNESYYALVATDIIPKGSELFICYGTGKETSLELFGKYGFFWASCQRRRRSSGVAIVVVAYQPKNME
mmetsp:Transcript_10503/g.16112  ORF Transcript_10503/g.16112 Transcript_10503/m.16112 type:complete len:349 (-) Transcript_10503:511-1557(-)